MIFAFIFLRDVRFQLAGFHPPLMNKRLCVIAEATNYLCEVVVELSPDINVGDDLFVLQVSVF
jgi:hypothetical protein